MEKNNFNEYYKDDEIDLYDIWLALKKRKLIILFTIMVSLGIAIAYVALAPRIYRVSNTLILNQVFQEDEAGLIKKGEIIVAINDMNELLDTKKKTALNMRMEDLNKIININASEIKESSALRVDIETADLGAGIALMEALPAYIPEAPIIAGKLARHKDLLEKNKEDLKLIINNPMKHMKLSSNAVVFMPFSDQYILRDRYNRLNMMIAGMDKNELLKLARKTEPPTNYFKPKILKNVLIGLAIGFFLGIFFALLMEWSDYSRHERSIG